MRLRPIITRLGTFGQAVLVNMAAAAVIVGVALFAICFTILSGQSQLVENATLRAGEWVAAALDDQREVKAVVDGTIELEDINYLRSVTGIGSVYRLELFRPDGAPAIALTPTGTFLTFTSASPADPRLLGRPVMETNAEHRRRGRTSVILDLPVTFRGAPIAIARVYLDQTISAALVHRDTSISIGIAVLLGGLGLANCLLAVRLLFRQRATDRRIHHLAHHDPLTGIANRAVFQQQLADVLGGRRPADARIALHLIDLDNFKGINDALGHAGGDELLCAVAGNLAETLRNGDVVARIGGDEFAVIQRAVETVAQAATLADRMQRAVRSITELNGIPVSPTLSIGVAFAPEHATDAEELQRAADAAVYRAKALGRNRHVLFEAGMDEQMRQRNEMRILVRQALEEERFALHFQPLHTADGALCGFEALLRLPDGNGGLVLPAEFIPIAEEMKLTGEIGAWVLGEACRAAASWHHGLAVAVNLSLAQFDGTLCEVVAGALAAAGLPPSRLELEITEAMLIARPDEVMAALAELKSLGIGVVIDDFGTGYSSLSHIWTFPFDKLKVDRSCFQALGPTASGAKILEIIALMSNAMNIGLVAEGIESEMQRDFALANGYDQLQGFLYGRPMPAGDVPAYAGAHRIASVLPAPRTIVQGLRAALRAG